MDPRSQKLLLCVVFVQSRQKLKRNQDRERKELFRIEFFSYGVKLEEGVDFAHPRLVCQSFPRYFYRLRSSGHPPESHSLPFTWEPHSTVKKMEIVWMGHSHHGI